jgi:Ca2+-dependent lipid-binding protein
LKPGPNDIWLKIHGSEAKLHVVLSLDPTIHVNILGANDLRAADLNGKSDPYCIMKFGKVTKTTKTLNKTLNPNWNEYYVLEVHDLEDTLNFTVYDSDIGKDDVLGKAIYTLSSLKQMDTKVALKLDQKGQINLEIKKIGF